MRKAWRVHHPTGRADALRPPVQPHAGGNRFGLPAFFSLHAWVWDDNPAGTFTDVEPEGALPCGDLTLPHRQGRRGPDSVEVPSTIWAGPPSELGSSPDEPPAIPCSSTVACQGTHPYTITGVHHDSLHGHPPPRRAVSADDVAKAHMADLQTQDNYGVNYQRYWVDEGTGKIFCLVEAPDAGRREHRAPRGPRPGRRRGPRGQGGVVISRRVGLAVAAACLTLAGAGAASPPRPPPPPPRPRPASSWPPSAPQPRSTTASSRAARRLEHPVPGRQRAYLHHRHRHTVDGWDGLSLGQRGQHRLDRPDQARGADLRPVRRRCPVRRDGVSRARPRPGPPAAVPERPWLHVHPPGNRFLGATAFWSLHVWAWEHNPSGTYAMWNPKITCP